MAFTKVAAVHVDWWPEWQMRVLVLGSLFVHMSLFFADAVRRSPRLRLFMFLVRWAYVGGDTLAIYALGTLLNRQQKNGSFGGGGGGGSDIELLWAPVLLIHLGGQQTLSANSLEDNEQWMRHVVTLVSKVTVALYVFFNWWSGERRLLNVAVLLFVVGIIRFIYKPWALRQASLTSMASSALEVQRKKGWFGRCWFFCTGYLMDVFRPDLSPHEINMTTSSPPGNHHRQKSAAEKEIGVESSSEETRGEDGGGVTTLEAFIRRARRLYEDEAEYGGKLTGFVYTPVTSLYKKFVSSPPVPYKDRLKELKDFLRFSEMQSYKFLQQCLYSIYKILYTKQRITLSLLGMSMQLSLPFLSLASVVLFAKSHKGGYDVNDILVSYILFCFTALHEFLHFVPSGLSPPCARDKGRWHDMVSQGSLLGFCARQDACTKFFILPNILKETLNKCCHVEQKSVAEIITRLVRNHIEDGWKTYIYGPISYRGFSDLRGQWALEKYRHKIVDNASWSVLASSLTRPFDESVLKWHVATDLCYYKNRGGGSSSSRDGNKTTQEDGLPAAPHHHARVISNYMAYQLLIRPEILVPGARSDLFLVASDLVHDIIQKTNRVGKGIRRVRNEQDIANLIIISNGHQSSSGGDGSSSGSDDLIVSAKKLADALGQVDEEEERWKLIEGVWLEMLCFSAARCSGYLHARSLGDGGEFLSYIWLLWSAMGMETLAEKILASEPPGEEVRKQEEEKAMGQQRNQSPARRDDGGSIVASSSGQLQVEIQIEPTTVDISPYSSTA